MSGGIAPLVEAALGHHHAGALPQAEQLYLRVLAVQPKHSLAGHNLALILAETGRAREAVRRLERLVKASPQEPALHLLLGRLLGEDGLATRSLYHLRRALALAPDRIQSRLEAIAAASAQHRPDDAVALAEQAALRFPDRPEIAVQAAIGLLENNRPGDARPWLERALAIDPAHAVALYNLAVLSQSEGDWASALALFRRAHQADSDHILPPTCLGDLELKLGDVKAAIASLDSWLRDHPHDAVALSNRLMAAQYVPGVTAASLGRLHGLWQERVGGAITAGKPNFSQPSARLRVGLVSGDLRAHPVGIMTIRGIEALDPAISVVAYAGTIASDTLTDRFRACATKWHDVAGWTDAKLAETVRQDGIDVLIDMSGHTTDIRLGAFARRPAPVQVSWAGYFGTTGCAAIDFLIADRHLVPPGEDKAYTETILRMPSGYLCYDPPADAPDIVALVDGPLRFAAFHHPAKINAELARLWAQVLVTADPGGRAGLHFTYDGFELHEVQQRVIGWFAAEGVAADRLHFTGRLARPAYFTLLSTMHVALDPLPYSGGAITCDALWMGVPVVSMPGQSFAGRHSQTHLLAAGLDGWVAQDEADYVRIATRLAGDIDGLRAFRATSRDRLAASALCDGTRFGEALSALLREAANLGRLAGATSAEGKGT